MSELSGIDLSMPASEAARIAGSPGEGSGTAPGTGDTPAPNPPQSPPEAAPSTTEAAGTGAVPETVPYARFKEVNDGYKPYKELQAMGHTADSLRELAEWERSFDMNPVGSWMAVAEALGDQMPESVREAVAQHRQTTGAATTPPGSVTPTQPDNGASPPSPEEPPAWAKPLIEDFEGRTNQAREDSNKETLDKIVNWWLAEDKELGIKSPDRKHMLTFIAGNAGIVDSIEDLQSTARQEWLELTQGAVQESIVREPGGALPVPDGVPPANPAPVLKTLKEANARVLADVRAGRLKLPTIEE